MTNPSLVTKASVFFSEEISVLNPSYHLARLIRTIPWEYKTHPRRGVYQMGKDYNYSGIVVKGRPFDKAIQGLMDRINEQYGFTLNSCLLNYYPDGNIGIGDHSDSEKELNGGKDCVVVSISLGATRDFKLRSYDRKEEVVIPLTHGSVLVMGKGCQRYYKHRIDVDRTVTMPRVNLTFRDFLV